MKVTDTTLQRLELAFLVMGLLALIPSALLPFFYPEDALPLFLKGLGTAAFLLLVYWSIRRERRGKRATPHQKCVRNSGISSINPCRVQGPGVRFCATSCRKPFWHETGNCSSPLHPITHYE